MNKIDWNVRFMELADYISQWSKDRSTRVGAIIVNDRNPISMGYNGFPRGSDDNNDERHERPDKYEWVLHAEENAIINAARHGQQTKDCEMYVSWFPCSKCAGMIVNSGIKKLFCDKRPDFSNPKFGNGFKISLKKLEEGGVEVIYLDYDVKYRQANV